MSIYVARQPFAFAKLVSGQNRVDSVLTQASNGEFASQVIAAAHFTLSACTNALKHITEFDQLYLSQEKNIETQKQGYNRAKHELEVLIAPARYAQGHFLFDIVCTEVTQTTFIRPYIEQYHRQLMVDALKAYNEYTFAYSRIQRGFSYLDVKNNPELRLEDYTIYNAPFLEDKPAQGDLGIAINLRQFVDKLLP